MGEPELTLSQWPGQPPPEGDDPKSPSPTVSPGGTPNAKHERAEEAPDVAKAVEGEPAADGDSFAYLMGVKKFSSILGSGDFFFNPVMFACQIEFGENR